jgi:TRAP-type C4-dicarboxylate transport system substrate-binding protein
MITSPSTGVSSQAWDFVSHYTDTQAWLPKNMVIVNTDMLEGLSDAQREALMRAAETAETRGWEMSERETATGIATLEENGMTVMQPTDTLSGQLQEIGKTMTSEWLDEAGEAGAAVVEDYRE